MLRRWTDYRQRQRRALRESHQSRPYDDRPQRHEPNLISDTLPPLDGVDIGEGPAYSATAGDPVVDQDPTQGPAPEGATAIGPDGRPHRSGYGKAGRPLNRQSPFYVGFFGAIGVLLAVGLWNMVGQLAQVMTLLVVALFITLALNPIVEAMVRRDIRRALAVTTVFAGLVVVFVSLGLIVVPPVVQQGTLLAENAPTYLNSVLNNRLVRDLDTHYQVADKLQAELQSRVTDGNFMSGIAGGVLGAGKAVLSGFFSFFTVLVLTLYFLSSLPKVSRRVRHGARHRRPRVISLSEEIMRRVGSYAIGQVAVAAINATASWIMMTIVGIPSPRCSRSPSASWGCCPWSARPSARRWSARSRSSTSRARRSSRSSTTWSTSRSRTTSSPRGSCSARSRCRAR